MALLLVLLAIALCAGQLPRAAVPLATSPLSISVLRNNSAALEQQFKQAGLVWGGPLFLRAFKYSDTKYRLYRDAMLGLRGRQMQTDARARFVNTNWYTEASLEIYGTRSDGTGLELFRSYTVCAFSGKVGPKRKEGDGQTPEGFYTVVPSAFNPRSSYRLSFNLGYPNRYDKLKQRSGGMVMVHGYCASIGCLAMVREAGFGGVVLTLAERLDRRGLHHCLDVGQPRSDGHPDPRVPLSHDARQSRPGRVRLARSLGLLDQ